MVIGFPIIIQAYLYDICYPYDVYVTTWMMQQVAACRHSIDG